MSRRLQATVLALAAAIGLGGCYYGPGYPAYGYGYGYDYAGGYYGPNYGYYYPGYYYGPSVSGSLFIGSDFGGHHHHRRHHH
jgi:hypothetical protein